MTQPTPDSSASTETHERTTTAPARIEGVLVVDKPVGPTSFDVVHRLRKALGTREIGHCGTLDPLASGVMVVLVGRYTRLVRFLTADDKRYVAHITFGARMDTDDLEGIAVERGDPSVVHEPDLLRALTTLTGEIDQVPPIHSAIQKDGERLYFRARRGEDVQVDPRRVVVHALQLREWRMPTAVVEVHCGKGTYVRALARDCGTLVGCPAHLSGLRRTASGLYTLDDAIALDELRDPARARAALQTGPAAIRGMGITTVDDHLVDELRKGRKPPVPRADHGEMLAVRGDELIAIVVVEGGLMKTVRGF